MERYVNGRLSRRSPGGTHHRVTRGDGDGDGDGDVGSGEWRTDGECNKVGRVSFRESHVIAALPPEGH